MNFKDLTGLFVTFFLTFFVAVCWSSQETSGPSAYFPETSYEFSPVLDGTEVVHEFVIQNKGADLLKVDRVKTG